LFQYLGKSAPAADLQAMQARVEGHLALPAERREAEAESLFRDLAAFTAQALARKRSA
jgi:hypothetical protein